MRPVYEADPRRDITIRLMRPEDVAQVAAMEAAVFSRPWSAESFQRALEFPEQILLVAEADGICGYGVLFTAADQADVSNIAAAPSRRREGIGDALLREMLKRAGEAGVREVFLEVRRSNAPAIGLYRKYGFEQIAVRKGYYEEPKEDALLMRAYLIPSS